MFFPPPPPSPPQWKIRLSELHIFFSNKKILKLCVIINHRIPRSKIVTVIAWFLVFFKKSNTSGTNTQIQKNGHRNVWTESPNPMVSKNMAYTMVSVSQEVMIAWPPELPYNSALSRSLQWRTLILYKSHCKRQNRKDTRKTLSALGLGLGLWETSVSKEFVEWNPEWTYMTHG